MKKVLLYVLFAVVIIFSNSCSTKIDINAAPEDITVVYGLIDPADSVHYIKINKAFLKDNVSAVDLAADANNFNYSAGDLDVFVQSFNNTTGNLTNTYTLTRTVSEIPKNIGVFDTTNNVLYKFIEPNISIYNTYKLKIVNNKLNKEITAETQIVKNSTVGSPNVNQKISFWIGNTTTGTYAEKLISLTTGKDVGRASANLIFNYNEYYTLASGLPPVSKSIIIPLGEVITTTDQGGESLEWTLTGESFFSTISSAVNPNTPFLSHRELANISLKFDVAGTELSTFMQVSAPSNNLNQEKPPYTNINNGLGIFSSRTVLNWASTINPATGQVNLSPDTIKKLKQLGLGFCFGTSTTSGYKCTQL